MILLLIGCGSEASKLPMQDVTVAGHVVHAEIADDATERHNGLMHRETLDPDSGMLFVFPEEKPRSFWMKDTPHPLTIAYADRNGKIVKLVDMQPFVTDSYQSLYPAQYALEMEQGWFAENGIKVGDKIEGMPSTAE